jgi:hypothetical protein
LFGKEMKRVAGSVQLLLLIAAIGLAAGGFIFFRHQEKELVRRAERSIPGPLLGAARARDVTDAGREANAGGLDDDRGCQGGVVVAEDVGDYVVDRLVNLARVDERV